MRNDMKSAIEDYMWATRVLEKSTKQLDIMLKAELDRMKPKTLPRLQNLMDAMPEGYTDGAYLIYVMMMKLEEEMK